MKNTTARWAWLALVTLVLGGGPALGQAPPAGPAKDATLKPPTPSKPDEPPLVMTYLGGLLCVGLVALAALIPSKRGHQD